MSVCGFTRGSRETGLSGYCHDSGGGESRDIEHGRPKHDQEAFECGEERVGYLFDKCV